MPPISLIHLAIRLLELKHLYLLGLATLHLVESTKGYGLRRGGCLCTLSRRYLVYGGHLPDCTPQGLSLLHDFCITCNRIFSHIRIERGAEQLKLFTRKLWAATNTFLKLMLRKLRCLACLWWYFTICETLRTFDAFIGSNCLIGFYACPFSSKFKTVSTCVINA